MAALFSAGVQNSARGNESKNLIEFKAGKMELKGNKVVADKRKGMFYIHKERETMLTHVCWKDRTSGAVEDDLIVFPDDCHWSKVTQSKTGRVYLLRFTNSSKKLFFWMQEPKDTKDEEYSTKINKILNEPDDGTNGGADMMANLSSASTEQLLSQMFGGSGGNSAQEQMLQQFFQSGALGPRLGGANTGDPRSRARSARTSENSSLRPSRPVSSQAPAPIQLAEFQDIMSNLSGNNQASSSSPEQANLAAALPLDLASVLSSEEVSNRLTPHVPQEPSDLIPSVKDELKQSLNSPQFRQALSMFSTAFSSGQLAPIISQFNLGEDALRAASNGDLKQFVEALNNSVKKDTSENGAHASTGETLEGDASSAEGGATKVEGEPMEQENEENTSAEKAEEDKEMDTS